MSGEKEKIAIRFFVVRQLSSDRGRCLPLARCLTLLAPGVHLFLEVEDRACRVSLCLHLGQVVHFFQGF